MMARADWVGGLMVALLALAQSGCAIGETNETCERELESLRKELASAPELGKVSGQLASLRALADPERCPVPEFRRRVQLQFREVAAFSRVRIAPPPRAGARAWLVPERPSNGAGSTLTPGIVLGTYPTDGWTLAAPRRDLILVVRGPEVSIDEPLHGQSIPSTLVLEQSDLVSVGVAEHVTASSTRDLVVLERHGRLFATSTSGSDEQPVPLECDSKEPSQMVEPFLTDGGTIYFVGITADGDRPARALYQAIVPATGGRMKCDRAVVPALNANEPWSPAQPTLDSRERMVCVTNTARHWIECVGRITGIRVPVGNRLPAHDPALSPNGNQIAVVKGKSGPNHLLLVDLDKPDAEPRVLDEAPSRGVVFSPDGQVLYVRRVGAWDELVRRDPSPKGASEVLLRSPWLGRPASGFAHRLLVPARRGRRPDFDPRLYDLHRGPIAGSVVVIEQTPRTPVGWAIGLSVLFLVLLIAAVALRAASVAKAKRLRTTGEEPDPNRWWRALASVVMFFIVGWFWAAALLWIGAAAEPRSVQLAVLIGATVVGLLHLLRPRQDGPLKVLYHETVHMVVGRFLGYGLVELVVTDRSGHTNMTATGGHARRYVYAIAPYAVPIGVVLLALLTRMASEDFRPVFAALLGAAGMAHMFGVLRAAALPRNSAGKTEVAEDLTRYGYVFSVALVVLCNTLVGLAVWAFVGDSPVSGLLSCLGASWPFGVSL